MDKKQEMFVVADIKCWMTIGKLVDRLNEIEGVNIMQINVCYADEMLNVTIDFESAINTACVASDVLRFAYFIKNDLVTITIGKN